MNKWWVGIVVAVLAATFAFDAEAQRRFGGGGSFGRQSPQVQRQAAPPAQSPQAAPTQSGAQQPSAKSPAAGAPAARPASPWRGALMGLAAGLGIAALASWLGLGEALTMFLTVMLIGMALMALASVVLRRTQPATRPASAGAGRGPGTYSNIGYETTPVPIERASISPAGARPGSAMDQLLRVGSDSATWGIPAGFDTAQFLAHAKDNFARLQRAWTGSDLGEIADFTTDELFVSLTHELRARPAPAKIDVVSLEADLLGIESSPTEHVASVKFDGTLRIDGEIEQVTEVWNLTKPASGRGGWLLAGIQQLA